MKKTFSKVLCMLLVCAIAAFALTSCGGDDDTPTFKIGATGPLQGGAASYGISVQKGATVALEEINAAGGLNGYLFSFDMKDDQAEAAPASANYDTLFESGMQASLGAVTSASCKAFAAKAVEDKLFFVTPSASEQAVIEYGDNCFRICFGDPDQGTLAADKIKADGYTKVGCIYDTSDSYSAGIYKAFEDQAKKIGLTYTVQTFDKENNLDFSTQVEALKDCDVIFMPFYYTEASLVAKACASKDCGAVLFGCDGFDGIKEMFTASDVIPNKILYITPFNAESEDAAVVKFVNAYKAKYNETPDQFAADGYDAMMSIYAAMKAADVKDVNISAADLCAILTAKFTSSDFVYTGATGTMTWDKSGACAKTPQIVELKIGK